MLTGEQSEKELFESEFSPEGEQFNDIGFTDYADKNGR